MEGDECADCEKYWRAYSGGLDNYLRLVGVYASHLAAFERDAIKSLLPELDASMRLRDRLLNEWFAHIVADHNPRASSAH